MEVDWELKQKELHKEFQCEIMLCLWLAIHLKRYRLTKLLFAYDPIVN